ncbi:MAG: MATE family efflux transporter [Bacteroidales bacterium]|nr:MATE family efflux transporter [Bacteroidales bacterium]
MEGYHKENARIARNTLIFNVRMVCIMVIGLLATRLLFIALGVSDYGLYSVVAGVIALLSFLTAAMSATTRRYINIEQGKPDGDPQRIFNVCLVLHIFMAGVILVLAETLGLYYVLNWLKVPEGKMADAVFVYQVSTVVACIGIVNIPFQSLIESYEKFHITALVDVLSNVVRLGLIVLLVYVSGGNKLRLYALAVSAVTLGTLVAYHWICARLWPETIRWRMVRDSRMYREVFMFNFYSALGAVSSVCRSQGSNMVVNWFFGTVGNAAFAVAFQIENFTLNAVNKLTVSAAPQITQNYGRGNSDRTIDLVYKISRFTVLIMIVFVCSALCELDFLLHAWIRNIPEGAYTLCWWTLVSALVRAFCGGGTQTLEQATGKIKWFQISSSVLAVLALPLGALAFALGAPPVTIIWVFIGYSVVFRIVELVLLRRLIGFDVAEYFRKAYVTPALVLALMGGYMVLYKPAVSALLSGVTAELWPRLAGIGVTFAVSCICVYFVGMYSWERKSVVALIRNHLPFLSNIR